MGKFLDLYFIVMSVEHIRQENAIGNYVTLDKIKLHGRGRDRGH